MAHITRLSPMLQARDLAATIAFYRDVLGFSLDATWPEDAPTWCSLSSGDAVIMFSTYEAATAPEMSGSIYLFPDDIDAMWAGVKDVADVDQPLRSTEYGMREFVVHDPNGYHLAFGAPAG